MTNATLFDFYKFNAKLGAAKFLSGIDYQRCREFPFTFNNLNLNGENLKLLDLGTGKRSIFTPFVAYHTDCTVYSTDIGDYVFDQLKLAERFPELREKIKQNKFIVEKQDATKLTYPDETFERVCAISSLEHIPDDGDMKSIREAARVLKKGGTLVLTFPYEHAGFKEQFLMRKVYVTEYNKTKKEPVFFARYYDDAQLEKRIIQTLTPCGLELKKLEYLGERHVPFYFGIWCRFLPFRNALKYVVGFTLPVFAAIFYSQLSYEERNKAQAVVLTFEKK